MKLADITEHNFRAVIALQLKEEQKTFVATPLFSLAESYTYRDDETVMLFSLEENNEVVGFLSIFTEIETQTVYIWRMLIGDIFQGKGYGRKALKAIESHVRELNKYDKIVADYVNGNEPMKALLEKEGYVESGQQEEWNEIIMTKELKK